MCKVQNIPKNVDPEEGLTAQLHYHYQQLLVQGQWSPAVQKKHCGSLSKLSEDNVLSTVHCKTLSLEELMMKS